METTDKKYQLKCIMYQGFVKQNPIINQFNGYTSQNTDIPFRNNQLINQNIHVMSQLNNTIQQHKAPQPEKPQQKRIINNRMKGTGTNIIEEMLKPQKIQKNNPDILPNFITRQNDQKEKFKITNNPYKIIIKDKIITKRVDDINEHDLVVHKSIKKVDADINVFNKELHTKKSDLDNQNDALKIEFAIDNYATHKKKFEYKETFIRDLAYEQSTFKDAKNDYIEFYRNKQKEIDKGKTMCDQLLHNLVNNDLISKDELPIDNATNESVDLKTIMNDMELSSSSHSLDRHNAVLSSSSHSLDRHNAVLSSSSHSLDRHNAVLSSSSHSLDRHNAVLSSSSHSLDRHNAVLSVPVKIK